MPGLSGMPGVGEMPGVGGMSGPMVSMPAVAPPMSLAAAMQASSMQAPAFQGGPVNPVLQQTMHQRQKLPSPISKSAAQLASQFSFLVAVDLLYISNVPYDVTDY